jgi:DNA-binding NtrC family response regulator
MLKSDDGPEPGGSIQNTSRRQSGKGPLEGVLVYIVDDEPMVSEVVARKLTLEGANPIVFDSSVAAWNSLITANPPPQVLLTDYLMKSLNGLELIERCKQVQPQLKTILFSGSIGYQFVMNSAVKPDHFLTKPFNLDFLTKAIRVLIGAGA